MSIEKARKEILAKLERDVCYYSDLAQEYGADYIGCWPPPEGAVTYGERAEAYKEALAVFEATWQKTVQD